MKKFERIFLYSVLTILVFYVFLVDNNVESKVAVQEEIRARSIVIVNDAGQEVVKLLTNDENNGGVIIYNKTGNPVALMVANESGGTMSINNKNGKPAAIILNSEYGGKMGIFNKNNTQTAYIGVNRYGDGIMGIINKDGKVIGGLP